MESKANTFSKSIRFEKDTYKKLLELMEYEDRKVSNMIDILIKRAYDEMQKQKETM